MAVTNLCPEKTRFWSGLHLGSIFVPSKLVRIGEKLLQIRPLPLPIHHQYVTWWDPGLGLAFPSGLATWVSHQNARFCPDGIWETPPKVHPGSPPIGYHLCSQGPNGSQNVYLDFNLVSCHGTHNCMGCNIQFHAVCCVPLLTRPDIYGDGLFRLVLDPWLVETFIGYGSRTGYTRKLTT
jgi:hypothetical protein